MQTFSSIDSTLQDSVDAQRVPGVVALASRGGQPFYAGALGKRSIADNSPMTMDTLFWFASMTKAVTSVAAMQLVEQGKLHLDAPLANIVPGLASPQVLAGFDASGSPRLRPAKGEITLRHLLTHCAGFVYEFWNENIVRYNKATGTPSSYTLRYETLGVPLAFDPGTQWEYGINTDWVGRVVEIVSGQTIDKYYDENIFKPLGMTDTTFAVNDEQRERRSAMHARMPDGSLMSIPFEIPVGDFLSGGGGLFGTGNDYIRFLRMLLGGGRLDGTRILTSQTVDTMLQNQIGDIEIMPLKTALPKRAGDLSLYPNMVTKWGLGFLINTADVAGARRAGTCSWAGLANTHYWIDRQAQLVALMFTQILPFGDPGATQTHDAFERAVYASLDK